MSIPSKTRLISILSQPIRVVITVDVVVVILVGPRKLTLKYGHDQGQ